MTLEKKHLPFIASAVIIIWAGIIVYCVMLCMPKTFRPAAASSSADQSSPYRVLLTILTRPETPVRDPFSAGAATPADTASSPASPGIGLSAVSWDSVSPQALIYKTGAEQTQLVRRGDNVFGITILQIHRDSIIILAHGRKFRIYNSYWEQIRE
ncbi:MAG: hypothetical protein HZC28_15720 [Spirochaetes bacterium]|nr:hypothetical protein [Spirochaetota bacterium]